MKNKQKQENWGKDLIKKHKLELLYYAGKQKNEVEDLISDIRQLLSEERKKVVEEIEKLKDDHYAYSEWVGHPSAVSKFVDEIIKRLK